MHLCPVIQGVSLLFLRTTKTFFCPRLLRCTSSRRERGGSSRFFASFFSFVTRRQRSLAFPLSSHFYQSSPSSLSFFSGLLRAPPIQDSLYTAHIQADSRSPRLPLSSQIYLVLPAFHCRRETDACLLPLRVYNLWVHVPTNSCFSLHTYAACTDESVERCIHVRGNVCKHLKDWEDWDPIRRVCSLCPQALRNAVGECWGAIGVAYLSSSLRVAYLGKGIGNSPLFVIQTEKVSSLDACSRSCTCVGEYVRVE